MIKLKDLITEGKPRAGDYVKVVTGEVGQINKVKGKIAWIKLASNKKSFFPSDIKNLKPTGKREKGKTLWTEGILTEGSYNFVKGKYIQFPDGELSSIPDERDRDAIMVDIGMGGYLTKIYKQKGKIYIDTGKSDDEVRNGNELAKWLKKNKAKYVGIDDR